jgi:hypothetical protein
MRYSVSAAFLRLEVGCISGALAVLVILEVCSVDARTMIGQIQAKWKFGPVILTSDFCITILPCKMSTTTILETYDTQMLDYSGDIDVPMHGSTETWFQTEAPMEDDGQLLAYPSDHESVEVDMERAYEGEYTEYEMADEAEAGDHHGGGAELVDIDVYDASHAPTPALVPVDLNPMPPSSVVTDTDVSPQAYTDPTTSLPLSVADHDLDHPVPEDHHDRSNTNYGHELLPSALIPSHFDLNPTIGDINHTTDSTASYTETYPDTTAVSEDVEDGDHYANIGSAEGTAEASETIDTLHHTDNFVHEEEDVSTPVEEHNDILHVAHSPEHIEAATERIITGDDVDPHEISEGVYIDPPPAVLLTVPFPEQAEFCLFNQPSSGANSPSTEGSRHDRQVLPLLLQYRPTLYYEPIAHVFEALRQDDHISQLSEIIEGELVLDAYDLQLVISEVSHFISFDSGG